MISSCRASCSDRWEKLCPPPDFPGLTVMAEKKGGGGGGGYVALLFIVAEREGERGKSIEEGGGL